MQAATEQNQVNRADALRSLFPHLIPAERGGGVFVAKNIRIELKAAFPGVNFSVTSDYSAVNIRWTDGPNTDQVEAIVSKYEAGRFDGMTDCYDYQRSDWTDAFGAVRYIFTSRDYSDAIVARVMARIADDYGAEPMTVEDYRKGRTYRWATKSGDDLSRNVHAALAKHTFCIAKAVIRAPADGAVLTVNASAARH